MTPAEYNLARVQGGSLSAFVVAWLSGFHSVEQFQAATVLVPDGKIGPITELKARRIMTSGASPGFLLDASHHQRTIDIALFADRGIRGLYHKATQGRTYIDPAHKGRAKAAQKHGLKFGSYHFAEPGQTASFQAEHFLRHMARGGLVPVLDIEGQGWTSPMAKRFVSTFVDRLDADGVPCVVYTGVAFLTRNLFRYARPNALWIARYSRTLYTGRSYKVLKVKNKVAMWQFMDGGGFVAGTIKSNGAPGRIGVNVAMQDKFFRLLDDSVKEVSDGSTCN